MEPITFIALLLGATVVPLLSLPWLFRRVLVIIGQVIQDRGKSRRQLLFQRARTEEQEQEQEQQANKAPTAGDDNDWEKIEASGTLPSSSNGAKATEDWEGIVGFFHPFCNAGGGGERVLWAAIRATQQRYPKAVCVVYTGDHDVDKATILNTVSSRFNIHLHAPRVAFRYLSTRHYVLASTWPRFTLLGQSFGSLLLAWDAFNLIVPDIFIDTMGYAFSLALCKLLFPSVPTCAYVHYPTISTDMLTSLSDTTATRGVNAGKGSGWRGAVKRQYWLIFAWLYSLAGGTIDVVMTNSSWTQNHIVSLWGRRRSHLPPAAVVFPPVAVEGIAAALPLGRRPPDMIYISQFRPEKNHALVLRSFARFVRENPKLTAPKLALIGSVRDDADKTLVYTLRLLARELGVDARTRFVVNEPWRVILEHLREASVGVNGMWNEHFGIGVVEYQAAGLISVVNASGGPKMDIVVDVDGGRTGFHAGSEEEYAEAFKAALTLGEAETDAMRRRARKSALRFTEEAFRASWTGELERLVGMVRA